MLKFHQAKILKIKSETPTVITFVLEHEVKALPGQFIMLTDYCSGEKPFSFSRVTSGNFELTLRIVGKFTRGISNLKEGGHLYFRGPYGNTFDMPEPTEKIILIGGGCGTAPMRFLLERLLSAGCENITFINGAKTKDELLFTNELNKYNLRHITATDDGTAGEKQNTSDAFAHLLKSESFDRLYSAGPELMMKAVHDKVRDLPVRSQFLLERYMKCGIGICGQCTLDPIGVRMCIEGPVVSGDFLAQPSEFGNYTRDAYGARKNFIANTWKQK